MFTQDWNHLPEMAIVYWIRCPANKLSYWIRYPVVNFPIQFKQQSTGKI
jgi:hypothetical protein